VTERASTAAPPSKRKAVSLLSASRFCFAPKSAFVAVRPNQPLHFVVTLAVDGIAPSVYRFHELMKSIVDVPPAWPFRSPECMSLDLPLRCRCGRMRGVANNVSPSSGFRFVCYCKDCQASQTTASSRSLTLRLSSAKDRYRSIRPRRSLFRRGGLSFDSGNWAAPRQLRRAPEAAIRCSAVEPLEPTLSGSPAQRSR
jgi:hypothetical protein